MEPSPAPASYFPYDPQDATHFGAAAVVTGEYAAIRLRRGEVEVFVDGQPVHAEEPPPQMVGLALSGGGIRSASFGLGVMQALAHAGWLRHVDYLSTVSGGGYTGASLTWLLHRAWPLPDRPGEAAGKARFGVERKTFPYGLYPVADSAIANDTPEARQRGMLLRFLRQHGRYLTPGRGINLLSVAAVLLRNSIYSLTIYGGLLLVLFLLAGPLLFVAAARVGWSGWAPWPQQAVALNLALVPVGAALLATVPLYSLWTASAHRSGKRQYRLRRLYEQLASAALGLLLALLVLGALPPLHRWLTEPAPAAPQLLHRYSIESGAAAGSSLPARMEVREMPAVRTGGSDDASRSRPWALLTGGSSTLIGIVSSVLAFVRTQSGPGRRSWLPTGVLVGVGTGALVLGVLLLTYDGWTRLDSHLGHDWLAGAGWALGLAIVIGLLARLVNTNYLSVHRYYRDRLMETFMPDVTSALRVDGVPPGASVDADTKTLATVWPPQDGLPPGPYPIINTNVVLVSSRIPKFRGRGGDNFVLTPRHCGSNATGWVPTDPGYGWMTLASAMAISGAAVNPNTGGGGEGVTRQPLLSFLMGLLNIRLGYWVLNPMPREQRLERLRQQGARTGRLMIALAEALSPRVPNALWPGISELFLRRELDENSHLLQLSDGGHFENLGLYELVRRRLPLIVCCDAVADADYTFGDLANAIEKVRADFGTLIQIDAQDLSRLTPRQAAGSDEPAVAERGFLVARILYPVAADGLREGTLIYLTTTFFKALSADLAGYRRTHPAFPDQPTADQFFDEKQFDAYRELGYQTAWQMLGSVEVQVDPRVRASRIGAPPWAPAP